MKYLLPKFNLHFYVITKTSKILAKVVKNTENNKVIKIVSKIVTKYLLDIEMCQPHGWLYTAVVLPDSSADENL